MRRTLGIGRALVGIGAVLSIIGVFLPWQSAWGGDTGIPMVTANGFDGGGVLVFVAAVGLLALLLLPYASSSGRSMLDRSISFVLLGGLAVVGLGIALVQMFTANSLKLMPVDRVIGLWLTILGVALICWGVGEILGDRSKAH
jgi:hypothetical protein